MCGQILSSVTLHVCAGCVSNRRQLQAVCQTAITFQSTYSKTLLELIQIMEYLKILELLPKG